MSHCVTDREKISSGTIQFKSEAMAAGMGRVAFILEPKQCQFLCHDDTDGLGADMASGLHSGEEVPMGGRLPTFYPIIHKEIDKTGGEDGVAFGTVLTFCHMDTVFAFTDILITKRKYSIEHSALNINLKAEYTHMGYSAFSNL